MLADSCFIGTSNCNNGQVRLVNGSTSTQGRLEVCYNNVWGSVCGYNFNAVDGYVVCRELGLGLSGIINELITI